MSDLFHGNQVPKNQFPHLQGSEDSMDILEGEDAFSDPDQDIPPQCMARVEGLEDFALPGLAPAFSVQRPRNGPLEIQDRM